MAVFLLAGITHKSVPCRQHQLTAALEDNEEARSAKKKVPSSPYCIRALGYDRVHVDKCKCCVLRAVAVLLLLMLRF